MRARSATIGRVSSVSVGGVIAMPVAQPAGRSTAASISSLMRPRPSVSYTLRTSIKAMFSAASDASTLVGAVAFGSARACSAIGSVYMKPAGGAATISQVCSLGSNM